MDEQLYILFCESPFEPNQVDEDFEDQLLAATANGFKSLLFNYEHIISDDSS